MRALVTGASGFVGRHLCAHLAAEGDEVLPFGPSEPALDVLDRTGVLAAILTARPEAVYHLAGVSHVGGSFEKPVETMRVNVEGTLNVLDACRHARVRRVLVVGSGEVYGDGGRNAEPFSEESPLRPMSPYAVSKVAVEYLGLQAYLSAKLGTVMTRSFNHIGPGQSGSFVVPALAERIVEAEEEGLHEIAVGRVDAEREFNDVRDIVRAYRQLLMKGSPGSVYNVCTGLSYTVGEVAKRMIGLSTRPLKLKQERTLIRSVDPSRLAGNPTKLVKDTSWSPVYALDETLAVVLDHHRKASQGGNQAQEAAKAGLHGASNDPL